MVAFTFAVGTLGHQVLVRRRVDLRQLLGLYAVLWVAAVANVLLCPGIHGQMVYINTVTGVVAAKLSSWPEPQHAWKLFSTLRAFDAVSSRLAQASDGDAGSR